MRGKRLKQWWQSAANVLAVAESSGETCMDWAMTHAKVRSRRLHPKFAPCCGLYCGACGPARALCMSCC